MANYGSTNTPQPCCSGCEAVDPCESGCLDIIQTTCIEHGEDIEVLGVEAGDKLNEILDSIAEVVSGLEPTAYGDFNYGCLSVLNISSPQGFVEGVSDVICQILGTQSPGSITPISTLTNSVQTLNTIVNNTLNSQSLLSGFGTISGLSGSTATVTQLLLALQQISIDYGNDITNLTILGSVPLTANDSATIDFTTSGSGNHTLTGDVKISAVADNAVTAQADGIHVISPNITVSDTASVDMVASGTANHTLSANVKISAVAGNQTILQADGVYTPATSLSETVLVANDSTTINFTASGVNGHTLTGAVIIDPSINNLLTDTGSGLFVDGSTISISDNSVTNAKLRDSSAYSVIGRSAGSTGDPADITASADTVLRRSGSGDLVFGTIVTNHIGNDQVTFGKIQNVSSGTLAGRTTAGVGDLESISPGSNISLAGGIINTYGRTVIAVNTYSTNDTWAKPTGCNAVIVYTLGAGGGGAGANASAAEADMGSGGGSGGFQLHYITSGLGTTESVVVGVGGGGGDSGNAYTGQNGTGSSFGTHTGVNGGTGGVNAGSDTSLFIQPGGAGGTLNAHPTGLIAQGQGSEGLPGIRLSDTVAIGGLGGSSVLGGTSNAPGAGGAGVYEVNGSSDDGYDGGAGLVIVYSLS